MSGVGVFCRAKARREGEKRKKCNNVRFSFHKHFGSEGERMETNVPGQVFPLSFLRLLVFNFHSTLDTCSLLLLTSRGLYGT
jgi:hypothetical protein